MSIATKTLYKNVHSSFFHKSKTAEVGKFPLTRGINCDIFILGILLSNKKEQATNTYYNMNKNLSTLYLRSLT